MYSFDCCVEYEKCRKRVCFWSLIEAVFGSAFQSFAGFVYGAWEVGVVDGIGVILRFKTDAVAHIVVGAVFADAVF